MLTDSQAYLYLNKQADAGLKKHKEKTKLMGSAVDMAGLNEHQQREHDTNRRVQQFIRSAYEKARMTTRDMKKRGVEIPGKPLLEADDA